MAQTPQGLLLLLLLGLSSSIVEMGNKTEGPGDRERKALSVFSVVKVREAPKINIARSQDAASKTSHQ